MMTQHKPIEVLQVTHLFPEMRRELLDLLANLDDEEWDFPTACEGWTVRDVAIHILGDDIGLLSNMRDNDGEYGHFDDWQDLVAYIDKQNEKWVVAGRRISRELLLFLLETTGKQVHELFLSLEPEQQMGSVGWTGTDANASWLHIARELTEFWMHHQHIARAVSKTSLMSARYVHPVLNTFVHALPNTYRNIDAPESTLVKFIVIGEGGGDWFLLREDNNWNLYSEVDLPITSTITLDIETAWKLFTKGIDYETLHTNAQLAGNLELAEVALNAVAIIA